MTSTRPNQQRSDLLFNERVVRSGRGLRKQIRPAMQMQTPQSTVHVARKRAWKFPRGSFAGAPNRSPALSAGGFDSSGFLVDSREPDKEPDEQLTQLRCPMPTAASKDHPSWTIAAHLESLLFSPLRLRPSVFSNSYLSFVLGIWQIGRKAHRCLLALAHSNQMTNGLSPGHACTGHTCIIPAVGHSDTCATGQCSL